MLETVSSRRAALAYFLGLCFFCYAFVQRVLPSVMIDGFAADLAISGAALGVLSGAYFYAYAAMQVPVGLLIDRHGPRKLLSAAMLVCVAGSAWMAASESLTSAAFARALIGAAVAFGFVGTLSIIARFFPSARFALLAGVLQSAGMMGAILGQAPLRLLVEQLGWRGTLSALAAFALALAIVLWLFLPSHQTAQASTDKEAKQSSVKLVLLKGQNWICAGLGFGLASTMLAFAALWAVPWLQLSYNLDTKTAASLASLNFLGNALTAPLFAWWSDRMGRRKPVLLIGASCTLIATTLIIYIDHWSTYSLAVLFFCTGFAPAVIPTAFAAARELNTSKVSGTALGLVNMFVVGSGALLQPLIGALLDMGATSREPSNSLVHAIADYDWAFTTLVLANALAVVCALLLRETNCRNATTT